MFSEYNKFVLFLSSVFVSLELVMGSRGAQNVLGAVQNILMTSFLSNTLWLCILGN